MTDYQLDQEAITILRSNEWGGYTLPALGLYPYQWNWDSMFVALGYSEFDINRAWKEVITLFQGQWSNGMAAHIVFRRDEYSYFPGPKIWGTGHCPPTSGCSQPPVAATVVRDLYEADTKNGFENLRFIFPKLMAWHRWFHTMRVISGGTAIAVTHPWESGRDNSPDWDKALANVDVSEIKSYKRLDIDHVNVAMRPSDEDYDRYLALVEFGRKSGWDHSHITQEGPFAVADPGVSFILMRADKDLLELANILDDNSSAKEIKTWLFHSQEAANYLWSNDLEAYVARDMRTNEYADGISSVGFLSYYAGITKPKRDEKLQKTLKRILKSTPFSLPSFDPENQNFDPLRYWRGPVWAIINFMVARGLSEHGFEEESLKIKNDTRTLIRRSGFYEYYNPIDGSGAGGNQFAWTAAIWLAWASPSIDDQLS